MELKDITPKPLRCGNGDCCPGIYETQRDSYVIIGKKLSASDSQAIVQQVGQDELVIEIPKAYFSNLKD